jgi:hypothetical protein
MQIQQKNPKTKVTVAGHDLILRFDVNKNPTKMGIKLQFVLSASDIDPKEKQELANKISTALQKRLGDAGIVIDYDTQVPYKNVIGYVVPIHSIADILVKLIKGESAGL